MKQKILYILMIITAVIGGNGDAWAQTQTTSYVLEDGNEYTLDESETDDAIKLDGPGATLTFDACKTAATAVGSLEVQQSNDKNSWTKLLLIKVGDLEKNTYKSFSVNIQSTEVRYIRFKANSTSYKRKYKNVKVTRATTLSAPSTVDMGEVKVGLSTSTTFNVDFNNTTYPQQLTGSSTNSAFSIEPTRLGETGRAQIKISFSPTTVDDDHSGTVTLQMGSATTTFTVSGVAVDSRGTPVFTWNLPATIATGREYSNFYSSTNNESEVSFSSSNEAIAKVIDGKLCTFQNEGSASITINQAENSNWLAKSETFTVNVVTPQNHLPLDITKENHNLLVENISGAYTWDEGVKLGDGGDGMDWSDKIAQIEFTGIPDCISFDYNAGAAGATDIYWIVESSPNGSNWKQIWTSTSSSGNANISIPDKSARFVRLIWSGNFGGFFKNVKISELRYLTTESTSLDFGENMQDEIVTPQSFVLKHCNAGLGVTVTSSNDNFIVSIGKLESTGGDKMGEETITVTYKNNTPGSHTGTITIADPNGANAAIILDVAGTTLSNTLFLDPTETPNYEERTYKRIVLRRTLPMGYSTITLPFTYDIDNVEGGAFVAQLELVTHNQQDCYTLYFRKVADGVMQPNQPYVLHMPFEITNAEWGETAISSPEAQSIVKNGWIMQGNYTPNTPMNGNFGIAKGLLCKGEGTDAKINAYTAYFIPPTHSHGTKNVRARVAVMDEGGNTTYIGELKDLDGNAAEEVFGIDGIRLPEMRKGINIVRQKDGSVRKIVK